MKPKHTKQPNLFEGGQDEWELSTEYKEKVRKIVEEVTEKYSTILISENNWIRRLLIKLRREMEIRKKVNQLSSAKNLHAIAGSTT